MELTLELEHSPGYNSTDSRIESRRRSSRRESKDQPTNIDTFTGINGTQLRAGDLPLDKTWSQSGSAGHKVTF